jgi:phosphonatase-like hydrolase
MVSLVVLDMAGTTVRDDGVVLECFVAAADAVGLEASRAELNARMGQSKLEVFDELSARQLGAGEAASRLAQNGFDAFRRILERVYVGGGVAPMPGAEGIIGWLRERGTRVALNTGFYRAVTEQLVNALGWRSMVDAVVCADDVPRGRPAPFLIHHAMQRCDVASVHEVVAVGDTPSDVAAGHNAGARGVVAVTSGSHTAAELRRCQPTHLVRDVTELRRIIERLERLDTRAQLRA